MKATTLSTRTLQEDLARAMKAADNGPVFVTEHEEPRYVLLSFGDYQRLTEQPRDIADALAMPGGADFEFEPPRLAIAVQPADLS